jgi:hypothetical protein
MIRASSYGHCSPRRLQLAQIVFQPVEALLPETAIGLESVGDVLERRRLELAGPPLRRAARATMPACSSTLRCLETAGRLISKGSANSVTEASPRGETSQDRAPRGVGECREDGAEAISRHLL